MSSIYRFHCPYYYYYVNLTNAWLAKRFSLRFTYPNINMNIQVNFVYLIPMSNVTEIISLIT